jgi:hypothetical protein
VRQQGTGVSGDQCPSRDDQIDVDGGERVLAPFLAAFTFTVVVADFQEDIALTGTALVIFSAYNQLRDAAGCLLTACNRLRDAV